MLSLVKRILPAPIKGAARRFLKRRAVEPQDKLDWEFRWQHDHWLELWKKPETQDKCLEYWRRFRHLDDIRRLVLMDEHTHTLDVGCGLSSVLHYLPGHRTGVDPLAERYKSSYRYPFDVTASSGEALPFADGQFDVAFCSNCIDHTTSPTQVIKEIRRVLKPDGRFVLTCEVFREDLGVRNAGHPHSITEDLLLKIATDGFAILHHWVSPWYGMRAYVLGEEATEQFEHIVLLQKS